MQIDDIGPQAWEDAAGVAVQAAQAAGKLLREAFSSGHAIAHKGEVEIVTEMDLASERLIREQLAIAYPGDAVLGEEEGGPSLHRGRVWIVDPLDGTTNYAHGLGIFSVSIAFCHHGIARAGAVFQPMTGELFHAWSGGGAWRNGVRIQVSHRRRLDEALVVTGFPYALEPRIDLIMAEFRAMARATRGVRRLGSAAMDLCYVAAGTFDIFWEVGLKAWDVAAGGLILTEAGGRMTRYDGTPMPLDAGEMLASNGHLHDAAREVLLDARRGDRRP
jgi:myo-inositol-1(or 4)-monophosphatase